MFGHCKLIQISSNIGTHQQKAESWDKYILYKSVTWLHGISG